MSHLLPADSPERKEAIALNCIAHWWRECCAMTPKTYYDAKDFLDHLYTDPVC